MACDVLRFGSFTLKSGRKSPYFFNSGLFNTGESLNRLGSFYASTYIECGISADLLYGPAYKGIPLACSAAMSLAARTGKPMQYAFNRKEAKDHGEGGGIVGAPLAGDVLIIDDVITAGTSVRESVEVIRSAGARPAGVLILLDRQEKGSSGLSATQEVTNEYGIPVYPVISLGDIVEFFRQSGATRELKAIANYQEAYGISL